MFAPTATALNHLLTQNNWALQRLARFAGQTARFDIAPFSFAYTVRKDGTLSNAKAATAADAVCVIAPSLLLRLFLHDEKAYGEIQSEGDAELLAEIFFLSRNLHWDLAEDLSGMTGDVAAERITQALQSTKLQLHQAAINLSMAAKEYWTEENPLLAKPQQISVFMQHVDILRDDISRLEQRIRQLAGIQDENDENS